MIGTLRRYSDTGGYGFIRGDDGSDIFVHASKLRHGGIEFPRVGMTIEFDVATKPGRKPFATRLRALDDPHY